MSWGSCRKGICTERVLGKYVMGSPILLGDVLRREGGEMSTTTSISIVCFLKILSDAQGSNLCHSNFIWQTAGPDDHCRFLPYEIFMSCGGRVTTAGGDRGKTGQSTYCHGLVDKAVISQRWNSVILEVFFSLNESVILLFLNVTLSLI